MADKDTIRVSELIDGVPRLNGANYADWSFAMKMAFTVADMWDLVSGQVEEYDRKKKGEVKLRKALSAITKTIEPSQYSIIEDKEDGCEAWKALKDAYVVNSHATRHSLKKELMDYRHNPSKPIQTYINDIRDIYRRMRAIGMSVTDLDVMDSLILKLDKEWDYSSATLSQVMRDDTKLTNVTSALVTEEKRRGEVTHDAEETAMKATHHYTNNRGIRERICYRCRQPGHISRYCQENKQDNGNRDEKHDSSANMALDFGIAY